MGGIGQFMRDIRALIPRMIPWSTYDSGKINVSGVETIP